jgi:hypothetical protein
MADKDGNVGKLKHELANAEQQKRALQHLLERASDEIEELVEGDCDAEGKAKAIAAARRFRRASSL